MHIHQIRPRSEATWAIFNGQPMSESANIEQQAWPYSDSHTVAERLRFLGHAASALPLPNQTAQTAAPHSINIPYTQEPVHHGNNTAQHPDHLSSLVATDLIRGCYIATLGREPSHSEMQLHLLGLANSYSRPEDFISSLWTCQEAQQRRHAHPEKRKGWKWFIWRRGLEKNPLFGVFFRAWRTIRRSDTHSAQINRNSAHISLMSDKICEQSTQNQLLSLQVAQLTTTVGTLQHIVAESLQHHATDIDSHNKLREWTLEIVRNSEDKTVKYSRAQITHATDTLANNIYNEFTHRGTAEILKGEIRDALESNSTLHNAIDKNRLEILSLVSDIDAKLTETANKANKNDKKINDLQLQAEALDKRITSTQENISETVSEGQRQKESVSLGFDELRLRQDNLEHNSRLTQVDLTTLRTEISKIEDELRNNISGTKKENSEVTALFTESQSITSTRSTELPLTDELLATVNKRASEVAHSITNHFAAIQQSGRLELQELQRLQCDLRDAVLELQRKYTRMLLLQQKAENSPKPQSEYQNFFDSFYSQFEDTFRGPEEEITRRLSVYLPIIKEFNAGTIARPILDLGCGRGEWLNLLRNNGLTARGVDHNFININKCTNLNLEVEHSDIFSYLKRTGDELFGAVSAHHVVEHLDLLQMITLLTEALRILKPGGILILETPNPENITVASCTFWLDPTHLKPIPPLLLEFHVRHAGFEHTKLLRLNHPSEFLEHLEPISHPELSAAFHGHMDYAIIARKRE